MHRTHISAPTTLALALALAWLAACRGEPAVQTEPPAPVGPTIELALDDGAPRTIHVTGDQPLAALVTAAPTTWLAVHAAATDDRDLEIPAPATRYRGSEVRLYLEQGRPAIGVFPPVTSDMPPEVAALARQPTAWLTSVESIVVVTRRRELAGLTIVVGGRELVVSSDQLHALAALPRGTSRAQGWPLGDVISLAVPDHRLGAVQVIGAGEPLVLDAQLLRDPARITVLKQNQRGEYVVRVWEADGRYPTREARRVTRVIVE